MLVYELWVVKGIGIIYATTIMGADYMVGYIIVFEIFSVELWSAFMVVVA